MLFRSRGGGRHAQRAGGRRRPGPHTRMVSETPLLLQISLIKAARAWQRPVCPPRGGKCGRHGACVARTPVESRQNGSKLQELSIRGRSGCKRTGSCTRSTRTWNRGIPPGISQPRCRRSMSTSRPAAAAARVLRLVKGRPRSVQSRIDTQCLRCSRPRARQPCRASRLRLGRWPRPRRRSCPVCTASPHPTLPT